MKKIENGTLCTTDETLYSVNEIRLIFRCGKRMAYNIMHSADFPAFKISRKLFVSEKDFKQWLVSKRGQKIC